jgi:hypothetical protein
VPSDKLKWEVDWTGYKPIEFTAPMLLSDPDNNGKPPTWADPINPK